MAKRPSANRRSSKSDIAESFNLWALAGEIGLKLAIPLLVFMLLGIKIDKSLNTLPLFTIGGILLAAVTSTYLVYRMIQQVNRSSQ